MTEPMLAKNTFSPAHIPLVVIPHHPAASARTPWRKEFQSNRKKIVDSAPLCVYVQVNLPNYEQTDPATGNGAPHQSESCVGTRSAFMTSKDKERRLKARRLYEHDHLKFAEIAAQCGVTPPTIARWARTEKWVRIAAHPDVKHETFDRRALVARAWRNAERQLHAVEKRLRAHGGDDTPLDESARLIATLVKTLRELAALDRALAEDEGAHGKSTNAPDSSDITRDLNAFYEELAARMDRLRQHRDGDANSERSTTSVD